MKYVKLIVKPDTWFEAGTEVYDYDCSEDNKTRVTLESWEDWVKYGFILVRGWRV